jgi:SAM-dependent methyltransferase
MPGEPVQGRAWYDEVAARPGGYARTWTQTVTGPDAQTIFDARALALAADISVLDAGCGDGRFTRRLAGVAAHVTGLDFSSGLLARAGQGATLPNLNFVRGHAREALPGGPYRLIVSRRGPNLLTHGPAALAPGGTLLALHPLNGEDGGRYRDGLAASGLAVVRLETLDDVLHFPSLADLAGYFSRFPGEPDLRQPPHAARLQVLAAPLLQSDGTYARPARWLLYEARCED